jgi:carbonic anhydrase
MSLNFAETTFPKHNEEYVSKYDQGHLELPPAKKVLIGEHLICYSDATILTYRALVTCMDARIEYAMFLSWFRLFSHHSTSPYSALGLKLGEAHVVRNAGGIA